MTSYKFSPTILREYDIRGQLNKNLSEDDAYALGRSFGTYIIRNKQGRSIYVGHDGRESSPILSQALIRGLTECGIDVTFIGLGPTPMLYFATKDSDADAGIMVTGSHNPPDYNGFKMMAKDGPIFGETIQALGEIAAQGDFENGEGTLTEKDVRDHYTERLVKDLTASTPYRIAWDNGNGAAGEILNRLTDKIPGEHLLLFDDIDGSFPNHHPDPTVDSNLTDLIQVIREEECDFGIAFDGDGDRIGVVDNEGNILRCDILMTLYASEILKEHPNAPIIGDIKCSQVMFDEIDRMGGQGVLWKTGHSLIKDKMRELNAPLAGELSGHIFFADKYYGFDDALYCAIRLINIIEDSNKPLNDLIQKFKDLHATAEVRFEVKEDEKFDLVPQVFKNLKAANDPQISINDIDGVRVSTPDGWWLLRPSNTQSVLVARAEGNSADGLNRLTNMAKEQVLKIGYSLDFSNP